MANILDISPLDPLSTSLGGTGNNTGDPGGSAGGDLSGSYPNPSVATNSITYAKLQQVSANSLLGNPTGSLANSQEISLGSTLLFSGSSIQTSAMTGDITSSANSFLTTLATVNSSIGTFGSSTQVGSFTVNAKGLITSASNITISGVLPGGSANGDLSGMYPNPTVSKINGVSLGSTTATSGNILIGSGTQWVTQPVSGDATINSTGSLSLSSVNANVGTFGSSTQVGVFTVNAKGLITSASNATITGIPPTGSAGGDLTGTYPNPTVAKLSAVAINSLVATNGSNTIVPASGTYGISISGNAATATTATSATTATNATNATNIATTSVATNASFFPLFVASSTNSNQASDLSPGLTFNPNTNIMTMSGLNLTPLTSGSVLFSGAGGAISQNNANLFWDNTNNRLGINTTSFDFVGVDLQITSSSLAGASSVIRNSVTGSANQAALYLCRGDATNGNALIRFQTGPAGISTEWDIGTFNSGITTNSNFAMTYGANIWLTLSNTGVLTLPQLTASQAIVTNSSKNLVSLAYTSANTASTIVSRDASGNFSAGTITASLSGNATSATNVATTQTSTNASFFPLMVPSSTNGNQASNLSTGFTFNPSTNTLNTSILQASNSLQVGTTTNIFPLTVQGSGGTTGLNSGIAAFVSPNSPVAGNIFAIQVNKIGTDAILMGVNKNTVTVQVAANRPFISSYSNASGLSIGRGDSTGLPSSTDIGIDGTGNVTINNGNVDITLIGKGLKVAEGTNAKQGASTLAGGTVTVSNTSVTATSRIFLTAQNASGTAGAVYVSARTAGTSFTITSTSVLDTRLIAWEIFEVG